MMDVRRGVVAEVSPLAVVLDEDPSTQPLPVSDVVADDPAALRAALTAGVRVMLLARRLQGQRSTELILLGRIG